MLCQYEKISDVLERHFIFRTHFDSSLWLDKYTEQAVLNYYQYVFPLKIVNTESQKHRMKLDVYRTQLPTPPT